MLLVDTSVWVDHFRNGNGKLVNLLNGGHVLCHHFIIGELACGYLDRREEILTLLAELPHAKTADHCEVLDFIGHHSLMGRGIGYIDIHLLASALLSNVKIWTLDKKLELISERLQIKYIT